MKKKIALMCIVSAVSTLAVAEEGAYFSGNFGVAIPTVKDEVYTFVGAGYIAEERIGFNEGFAFGAAIGYEFESNIRVDGEVSYQKNDPFRSVELTLAGEGVVDSYYESENLHTVTVMANTYYAFNNSSDFVPYVGGGIGYGRMFSDFDGIDAFSYQATAGLDYFFTGKFSVGVKYRFNGLVSDKFIDESPKSHNIYVGARVYF